MLMLYIHAHTSSNSRDPATACMTMALPAVGLPVVVCSGSSSDHHQQQVAAVDVEESPLRRRSAKYQYQPTTWDYDSICSSLLPLGSGSSGSRQREEAAAASEKESESAQASLMTMKDSVRRLLLLLLQDQEEDDSDSCNTRSGRLLIRTIHQLQSLGIAYHFHQEIRGILLSMQHQHLHLDDDLHSAALLFRMLRGLGIPASTDMLMSALREEEHDGDNSDALLALYQASYLAYPGETVLDQAKAFKLALPSSLPLHWTAPRLQAMWSLINTKDDDDVDPAILQLAQLDFNLVQALHRRELAEVTRWWQQSRLGDHSFARDRVVECFFCAACIAPEPRLADCREVLAKTGALIVHLDDIYDVHGTADELHAFTDAFASWDDREHSNDGDDLRLLPEYMKAMYSAILTTSVAAADRVLQRHGHDMLPLYKKAWHELCKAFLVEAQWQQQGHVPSFADYVSNGWVTSTGPLLLLHALPAAGIIPITVTQTTQANNGAAAGIEYPRLVELSSTIFRRCNDCASHQAESERGYAPSSIACCMAEPWCPGEEQAARAAVQGVIAETWKALNWEVVVAATSASSAVAETSTESMANLCLNLARIIHCIYQDGEDGTSPTHRIKQMVKDLLFNPIPTHHVL